MDTVYLKNYTVVAKHGYYKEEHSKPQRFVVSVVVTCDVSIAGTTDDLHETLNYEMIRLSVHDILMKSPHDLIESLAEELARSILLHPKASCVEVDISKPDVWSDCTPGVIIVRKK
jgi:dihydroneopterin aldolase / 2-amino-4-hydroxy-6-hydroxymethyldihydropteridine diphosphokinase